MSSAAIAQSPSRESLRSRFTAALVAASAIAALYVGRPVFVPLSLALLIAFALAPAVDGLRRFKIKPLPAVLASVGLAAVLLASVALFLAGQISDLAGSAPARHAASPLLEALDPAGLVEPLLNPLTSAGAAVVIAAFLLLNRDRLAERLTQLQESAPIVCASREFGRHLLSQGLLDLAFGTLIAAGLWSIGVPNFGLWALLGVMLRSVPFVGVPVAALCPLLLADRLEPTALHILETIALFLAVDATLLIAGRKLRRRTGPRLSAAAAVGATIAWTCLWGATGLLLAIPLTLGAVVLGRHLKTLHFLNRLLSPSSRDEACLCEPQSIKNAILAPPAAPGDDLADGWTPAQSWGGAAVLCFAGPGVMDEAAAGLLAQELRRSGLGCRVVSFAETMPASLPRLELAGARVACFCCLDGRDARSLRGMVRRVRPRLRGASAIAGPWGWDGGALMDAGMLECDLVCTGLAEAATRIRRLAREASELQLAAA